MKMGGRRQSGTPTTIFVLQIRRDMWNLEFILEFLLKSCMSSVHYTALLRVMSAPRPPFFCRSLRCTGCTCI